MPISQVEDVKDYGLFRRKLQAKRDARIVVQHVSQKMLLSDALHTINATAEVFAQVLACVGTSDTDAVRAWLDAVVLDTPEAVIVNDIVRAVLDLADRATV